MSERRTYFYARISSKNQSELRQIEAFKEYCNKNNIIFSKRDIYLDKESGKDFNRTSYQAMKKAMWKGDILVIKELDRLGRNYKELKNEWNEIVNQLQVDIIILDNEILNTLNKSDLEKQLIGNIIFELLAYMAEKERERLKQRQREGIEIAKAKGVYKGRKKIEIKDKIKLKIAKIPY